MCKTVIPAYSSAKIMITVVLPRFWATVCKTVCPILSDRCLSVCNVRILLPNGWMDPDETWHAGRPWPRSHWVRSGPSLLSPKGSQPPIFGPCLLWPSSWMDQDATWYGGRPRSWRHCVTWGPSSPSPKGHNPQFLVHVYCGPTVAHLSYCWALVKWISV